jgi:putative membrane protein insertion efficiency factor
MTFDYLEPLRLVSTALGFIGRWAAWALIWGYRLLLRPLFPATCRFEPSCSEYALIAVRRFGALRGGWLAARRLLRCNPWGPWGHDPVPDCTSHSHSIRIGYRREHP